MEFDSQLLQDLVEFLSSLEDARLPAKFETLRGKLLGRVQSALSGGTDNYINMQLGKPLKDNSATDDSSEEYVIPDHRPLKASKSFLYHQRNKGQDVPIKPAISTPSRPPTYLPLVPNPVPLSSPAPIAPISEDPGIAKEVEREDSVPEVYDSMTLAQAQTMSYFKGQLFKREKWLIFENLRPYSAVLIGSHFLSYDNKTDPSPSLILSIEECTCKSAEKMQRNAKKLSDSTFELYDKDNRSYQFIAPTRRDMMRWVAMIAQGQNKARDTKQVDLSSKEPPKQIPEEEISSNESSCNEDYDNIVITDIAGVLAGYVEPPKPNTSSRITKPPATKKPADLHKTPNHISPRQLILTKRTLPPPPPRANASQIEEEVYHMIENMDETDYDDIETVRRAAQQLNDMNGDKETGKSPSIQITAEKNEETYDDVVAVAKEAEQIRRNENTASPSTQIENKKKSPDKEPPAITGKPLQVKNFWGRLRYKNESPSKEELKKKPIIPTPQQMGVKDTPTKVKTDQKPSKTTISHSNNKIVKDISDYNSPPTPRPISSSNELKYNEEEPIYDDVDNKIGNTVGHHSISPAKNEDIATKFKSGPVPSEKPQKSVVRNLSKSFDPEIYENQPGSENVEDDSEFYQVPRGEARSLEDLNDQEIYDDVDIVLQKQRECEQAKEKEKLVVNKTPSEFHQGPAVMAKPAIKSPFNKLTRFISPVTERSTVENSIRHRLSPGKEPKPKAVIISLQKHEINSASEELYDDFHSKG